MTLLMAPQFPLSTPAVLTSAQTPGLTSMPWQLTAVDDRRRTIELIYVTGDGDCVKPRGIYLIQTPTTILIAVLSRTADRQVCGNALTMQRGVVHLTEPVGHRALVHAQVSPKWTGPKWFAGITA